MAHRIQYRRDTAARWASINPVLMEGEVGYETDTHHMKVGDGSTAWNSLAYEVGVGNITSELGNSEDLAMSQKGVTNTVSEYNVSLNHPTSGIDGTNKYTLATAIALIPTAIRNIGIRCSFLNEEGVLEVWECQSSSTTNVNNWINKTVSKADVVHRVEDYRVGKYIKEFYIKDAAGINSVRVTTLYNNVNNKNQVNVRVNDESIVSLEGTSDDTLLISSDGNFLCVIDFSDFYNYNYQSNIILEIATNLNLNPAIKNYLLSKKLVTKEEYSRLYGSFVLNEEKEISNTNAAFYLPYDFKIGDTFDVELRFSEPLTSSNVLICTSSAKLVGESARKDILLLGSITNKKILKYTLEVTQNASFFTFYTQTAGDKVLVKVGNFKNSEIGDIEETLSSIETDVEDLKKKDDEQYFSNKWKANEVVTCGPGRNYSTLYAAMQYAKYKASGSHLVEVQLYSDIVMYDDSQLHLSDEYTGSEQYYCICNVPPYVRLRGVGSKKIIALILNNASHGQSMTETIHLDGNSELENLHIIGYNLRYPIHLERGNNPPNIDSVVRLYNVDITHHGASQWQSPEAWGSGNASGMNVYMYGCRLEANFDTLFAHNWNELSLPIFYHLSDCSIINTGTQKVAVHIRDSGSSKQPYMVELMGNSIDGYVKFSAATSYKLVKPCMTGHRNSPHYFMNEMDMENIRIRSTQTGVTQSIIEKTKIEEKYLGNVKYELGAVGKYACIYWDNNLSALTGNEGTLLGKRLGDCSASAKTLVITVNGEDVSISFNKNYTNYSNQQVVDDINLQLAGKAVAELYKPLYGYYEELSDVLYNVKCAYVAGKGTFVKKDDSYVMLIDDVLSAGAVVRGIRNCVVSKSDQFAPEFENGANIFLAGDRFSVSENGKLGKDVNGKFIAVDDDKILIV